MNLLYRKIDEQVSDAIASFSSLKTTNTAVTVTDDKIVVQLHGNTIATIHVGEGNTVKGITRVNFNPCGWHTKTTRNRLNAVVHALHRLDYAHKIGGFKIRNGVIHILQHYGELNSQFIDFTYDNIPDMS